MLISPKDAIELLGVHSMAAVHHLAKQAGVAKHKDGHSTFFDKDELLAKVNAYRNAAPAERKKTAKTASKKTADEKVKIVGLKPFKRDPKMLAWHKGEWRGWCFAAVEDVKPTLIKVVTDYGKDYEWPPGAMLKDLAEGKAFVMEPAQVLRFMAMQFVHVLDNGLKPFVPKLLELAAELDEIEAEYKKAQAGEASEESSDAEADGWVSDEDEDEDLGGLDEDNEEE